MDISAVSSAERRQGRIETLPSFETFAKAYESGVPQVVWTRLVADLETPVSVYLKIAGGKTVEAKHASGKMSFLLESVEGGATVGRYSVIGLEPDIVWRAHGDAAEINRDPVRKPDAFKPEPEPTLTSLRALLDESRIDLPSELPPMAAGVFGYMGYDTIRLIERLPNAPQDDLGRAGRSVAAADADGDLRQRARRDDRRHARSP